jgi:hypothetical protein
MTVVCLFITSVSFLDEFSFGQHYINNLFITNHLQVVKSGLPVSICLAGNASYKSVPVMSEKAKWYSFSILNANYSNKLFY